MIRAGIREAIEELVTIRTAEGEVRQVPAVVAMVLKVRNQVLTTGSPTQLEKFFRTIEQQGYGKIGESERISGVLVVPGRSATAEDWERDYGRPLAAYQAQLETEPETVRAAATPPKESKAPSRKPTSERCPIDLPKVPELPRDPTAPAEAPPLTEAQRQQAEIRAFLERQR
jgi:hypothetical protein